LRVNYNYIKIIALIAVVVFFYAFTNARNNARKITNLNIKFIGENNLFIAHNNVSKLLIQNNEAVTNIPKEALALNRLESALNLNPMIKQAQVYVDVKGTLTAEVEQKKPIARVHTNASYYIDDVGKYMPLSTNYTARVPLVTGLVNKNRLDNIFKIAKKISNDEFLNKHVVEIHQNEDNTIQLKLRQQDFVVQLGSLKLLDKKINNLRAFYKKAMKDKTLSTYKIVNLRFDNQVVCTK
jgi:cell division protein FtsQ